MNMHKKLKGGFTLVELLVVIVIIAALAGLAAPQVMKMRKRADVAEAINNAKQLGLAMIQFDSEIGGFPDNDTVDTIERIIGEPSSRTLTGSTSNPYFRQLIESYVADSETPFYMKSPLSPRSPDGAIDGERALEGGEVGFGYIMQTGNRAIPSGGSRPIAAGPFNNDGEFDIESFDGRAVVLFGDNSARQLNIGRAGANEGKAILPSGDELLATGPNSIWRGIDPQMLIPEE